MTRNAAIRGTALLAVSLALSAPALAGDRAEFNPIGFSSDGTYFAFEEYGMEDGSGFPFSNIYVLDLPGDSWVKGTPIRVDLMDDGKTVADARADAADQAAATLDKLGIVEEARIIAVNGDGESGAPKTTLSFGQPGYGLSEMLEDSKLELESFDLPSAENCAVIDSETKGFALSRDGHEVTRDTGKVPVSRGCPMDYRIYAVVAPAEWTITPERYVAIVSSYPFGFEGPSRRFIAVPLGN